MGCVNKASKEFKELAERSNLSANQLELITHKYWIETGNETLFPTDVYIQAQLGNSMYQEDGTHVRELWEKQYSSTKEFPTTKELNDAMKEASKYFPPSAIMSYKNAKGNYVLSVKRPVEKLNYSKDDFFDDSDNMKSMRDAKTLDLEIKDKQSYGIGKVQELYNRFNQDKTSKDLAGKVFSIASELGLKVSFNETLPFGTVGRYTNNNTILFKKSWLERDTMNSIKAPIILHEVIHAISMYALSDQTKNWGRPKALQEFRTEMNSLYQELKNNPILKGERGVVDIFEFVAELGNPVFRAKIQEIDKQNKANKKSFWQRILDAFKSLLGIHVTNTYYERSMKALDKALNAFDLDTYMRYNGIKSVLRQGYNAKEWEFNSISDKELKTEVNEYIDKKYASENINKENSNSAITKLKPQYRGKLIYAQSGTGKSTIADNKTVFDSDYILGNILGVSTETAGFFFKTLSAKQKKVFGEQYRDTIKQMVADGYTVLTANESLLNDADTVIYNQSAQQTDERVNGSNRALTNKYYALEYHQNTLSKIKKFKDEDKENTEKYVELDGKHYLSDVISSGNNLHDRTSNLHADSKQKESNALLEEQQRDRIISSFLNEFGISVNLLDNYDGELPLFDALNRVINAKNKSDITEGVGYAIAFMMQSDPEMQRMIVSSHGMTGDYSKKIPIINKKVKNLHPNQNSPVAKEVLREIGRQITSELKDSFGTPIEEVKSKKTIWKVIKNFFTKLGMRFAALGKRNKVLKQENLFVKDIIEALGREDFSRIKGPRVKEGTTELAQRVYVEQALKDNPFEDNIIRKLGEHGIALAGSTSIALQGSLFRPSENPLHDIDFNAGNNSSKESLDKLLPTIFPNGTIKFSHSLPKDRKGNQTVTYILLSEPFTIKKTEYDTAEFYSKDGKYLGKREHYDLFLEDGVQGKMLDFFTGPTQESNYGFYKRTINGHEYLLSESNAAMAAKILWARPKDMWDYKHFKRNDFKRNDFIKSLSAKELKQELGLIKQESADYNLVNNVEEKPKNSGKPVPQDFTFNDGTTIKAPFRPNAQQIDALNAMSDFIKSDETTMTLSGYAGTGKTSLMEMIAKKCKKEYKNVKFCASTNKAAAVLKDRVSKAGFDATTLNKLFGIRLEMDTSKDTYDVRNVVNIVNEEALMKQGVYPGTTIIIDEASMIDDENYEIINNLAKSYDLKIIYVGDSAQLAPVNQDSISKVFRNGNGKVITLTQVERTDDNAILKEATDLRNNKPLSGESSFNNKGEGVAYVSPQNRETISNIIKNYAQGLKQNPNYFRILAYTNAAVAKYNAMVRNALGYISAIPQKGEPMMGYTNWGYEWQTKSYRLINSESYKVIESGMPKKIATRIDNGTVVTLEAIPITLEDSLGTKDTFNYIDVKSNPQNRQAATILVNEKKRLWAEARRARGQAAKIALYNKINDIENFLFVNDNIEDESHHLLQSKVIDFGYAMTVHKSQGSTFTNVLLDDVDITRGALGNRASDMTNSWEVALEEDSGKVGSMETLNSTEVVDLGDLSSAEEPSSASAVSTDRPNLKQQLEYVGVSRATDTVTVVSNNIKKEGSPLHLKSTDKVQNTESSKPSVTSAPTITATTQAIQSTPFKYTYQTKFNGNKTVSFSSLNQAVQYFRMEELFNHFVGSIPSSVSYYGKNGAKEEYARLKSLMGSIKSRILNAKTLEELAEYSDIIPNSTNSVIQSYIDDFFKKTSNKDVEGNLRKSNIWESLEPQIRQTLSEEMQRQNKDSQQTINTEDSRSNNSVSSLPFNAKDATFYSGGAEGSDKAWEVAATKAGVKVHNYTVKDWDNLSSEWKAKLDKEYQEVLKELRWSPYDINSYIGKLVRRDMMQADKADAIFAVGTVNNRNGYIAGGTGYASTRGILRGIPVYLFDQKDSTWKVWDKAEKKFIPTSQPSLTQNAAVIGTRELKNNGKKAIESLFSNDNLQSKNSNLKENGTEEYKTTEEFRRIQETVRGSGKKESSGRSVFTGYLTPDQRQRLANVLGRQLGSIHSFIHGSSRTVSNQKHGTSFNIHSEVSPKLFHDIFEIVRYYTKNAELVDLHDDYSEAKCFLTEDGTAGFAVEPNGNLVSVFNLGTSKGFLSAIKDLVREAGATHLDAYASNKQNLELMYEKTLGFHTAATMDYNMKYDHDDIAKNHGNPQVVFMVDHEVAEPKHFDKDSYDSAQQYQLSQLPNSKSLPTSDTKINIYAGTNENADLSNFAKRPFSFTPKDFSFGDNMSKHQFNSVEQAFQYYKMMILESMADSLNYSVSTGAQEAARKGKKTNREILLKRAQEILNSSSAAQARALGRKSLALQDISSQFGMIASAKEIANSIFKIWDERSSKVMKALLKASFEQNPQAAQRLLDTGNATLTHTQDKGKWGTEFPKLLMEVREELRKERTGTEDFSDVFQTPTSSEVEVEDVMKPWKNDASKSNKTRRIYLKGQKDRGYFEVVKDVEDNNYSVHFKPTDSKNPNAFTQEEKAILFKSVADIIPEGANLSTWGELSKGGIHGLNRFSELGFVKTDERSAKMKSGEDIKIPVFTKSSTSTVSTTEEREPQMVDLPGYEYFKELYTATPVDAEWKVSYLKELDSQLTMDKPAEEIDNILNKMDTILQSTSEKEYKSEVNNTQKKETEKELDEYNKINKQLDALLEGKIMYEDEEIAPSVSAVEVRHAAQQVADEISDFITELQGKDGNEKAKEWFPTLTTTVDFKTATREEIVKAVGINNLIQKAKDFMDTEKNDVFSDDLDVMEQVDLLYDNWDALMYLAADAFALNEGFGVIRNNKKGSFEVKKNVSAKYNNSGDISEDYSNDPDSFRESVKDEQEYWSIETRTVDVLNSMSALVRHAIHECYLLDENGNKVMSKWKLAERVTPRKVVSSILQWCQGAQNLEDMVAMLSEKQKDNTWLSQLITRLSDKSGEETDLQSQFYSVFAKDFNLYSIVKLENGKYYSMPVNQNPALTDLMGTITSKYKIGQHPLFTATGKVNQHLLGSEDTVDSKNDFNLHKALVELTAIDKSIGVGEEVDSNIIESAIKIISNICDTFGFKVDDSVLSSVVNAETIHDFKTYLGFAVRSLDGAVKENKSYDPFKFKGENSIDGTLRNFFKPIADKLGESSMNAFYDNGKMYQSYITPSYLTRMVNNFKLPRDKFEEFMKNAYGNSEWFVESGIGAFNFEDIVFRNGFMNHLSDDNFRNNVFDHKVELNFNKHSYMRNMSDAEYAMSLLTNYFENTDSNSDGPAWFRIPIMSNKPSSEFLKFYSYRGSKYEDRIVYELQNIFLQEVMRIQTVRRRNHSKGDNEYIENFDKNGRKFCFFPVFNAYLENTESSKAGRDVLHNEDGTVSDDNNIFANLLQKKIEGEAELTSDEETQLSNWAEKIIAQSTENKIQSILDKWERNGILKAAETIKGIYPSYLEETDGKKKSKGEEEAESKKIEKNIEDYVREQVRNALWNDTLASKEILLLTVTDIAFYKDTENLQKRLSQLHSPGLRGRKEATDYRGNKVSDGKYRTVIVKDFDTFRSNIIANINEVFDRKIAAATSEDMKRGLINLKDSLTRPRTYNSDGSIKDEGGEYWRINVADAQGYSSPSSYRKKAFIFGRWSHRAEDLYEKLMNGEANFNEIKEAFQPLKPFVYAKLQKNLGVEKAPIHSMPVPFQAKNSEYLLIMADAMLKGERLSRPNLLRAVFRVMEDSEKLMPTKGIDTIQFESAIKSGLQGAIDIHQFMEMPGGEEAAYTFMKNKIFSEEYDKNTGERLYRSYNTDVFVHETSYDNYSIQQEIPEHFKNHSQAHGSQTRMIIPSDLDLYTTDENGNKVDNYYEWTEPDGNGGYIKKRMKADEFRKEYENTIAESIEDSINILSEELHLKSNDKRERNIALSKILQDEIASSPRYGVDLLQACSVDKKTGEFRIPKGDPIQAKRIEQLINSIIKNRINKQKIAGGPIVQVSNFGLSQHLHIRFNDKKGNLIPLEEEYNPSEHGNMPYKDYLKKNQGGIAYFEVLAPVWDDSLVDKFSNPDGSINVGLIEKLDPELLKMVSYRIPTEDKYSCAPMKVVGFMPREAGDAIMLPYELTTIDDSDFDIDKRYVMRKEIPIKTRRTKEIKQELFRAASESYSKKFGKNNNKFVDEQIRMFLDNPYKMRHTSKLMESLFDYYQQIAFYTEAPTSGKLYRDNKIVDMSFGVLTNEMTADKILNPGGFEAVKNTGYRIAAYKKANNSLSWEELQGMSTSKLKNLSYEEKDITFMDAQIQFYKQNAAAASLIGVFAVNKIAHAILESDGIYLDLNEVCGSNGFTIAGKTFKLRELVDPRYDTAGNLIGKTLGSLVSASADAAKDPVLNLMNINMVTAGMLNTMLRLGMTFDDAALFLSQDIIGRMMDAYNKENLSNHVSLDELINKWISKYKETENLDSSSNLNKEDLSTEELLEGLTSKEHSKIDYKVLLAFQRLESITDAMRKPTLVTRHNSISSAVGPLIIDNIIMEHKMDNFKITPNNSTGFYNSADTNNGHMIDASYIFRNHPILDKFSQAYSIAKSMFYDMPAGSGEFRNCLAKFPDATADKLYKDRKLLDQFANFYQSYLLIKSGVVDQNDLKMVREFPKEFIEKNIKDKYSDNALIQAIKSNVLKKTGELYLTIDITDLDETAKEELRSAWIDLHKVDPELSKKLFDYSFFKAGVGFSPKTFMSLVPSYVKERIKGKNGASYIDTYRRFPDIEDKQLIVDQFILNNMDNNKLVPWRDIRGNHYTIDLKKGTLTIYREEEIADVADVDYIKTKIGKNTYFWKKNDNKGSQDVIFKAVEPLGNNGEYLEMNTSEITAPLDKTTKVSEREDASSISESSTQETDTGTSSLPKVDKKEADKNTEEMINLIMTQNLKSHPDYSKEEAMGLYNRIKTHPESYTKYLQNVFKNKGLDLDSKEVIDEFNKYC